MPRQQRDSGLAPPHLHRDWARPLPATVTVLGPN
jgi:hypothetical protein